MWVFYLISLPLTLGMVTVTLWYFAGPHVPRYVLLTVGYAWFCSISVIILVPADIWTTIVDHEKGGIAFFWSWSYWSTFALTWAVVPTIQSYEDAGDFTVTERLKTSIRANLVFYVCVGSIGLLGLILLILMRGKWSGGIVGFAMACSNTFGLVTGAFLLGFGLSEIPKSIWRNADWSNRQKVLSHRVAKMAVNLDIAHQEFSNAIVIAQATSKQMSKRDFLRPYMDVIDKMLLQMMRENPSFKPSGGMFGENDMDYDTDDKTMAALRRRLRKAQEEYYRYRSEYITSVVEALELEDTVKNYDLRNSTEWRYVSSLRGRRANKLGPFLDTLELLWRCILRKQLEKLLAVILGCMSAAILLAEATILPSGFDLSFFSILINAVGEQEMLTQIVAFVPLMYMCICTYYSLFKIGMLMYYSLTPGQTNSVSLLMICSMVARYAPPISYNFLNLIRLRSSTKTIFEKRMGNIDDAVPFFGKGFNNIYPLIMVIYTILVASNFFGRVVEFFSRWIKFKFQDEEQDLDGYDPSGLIILQKERSWLEQGHKAGELIIPLSRNFYETNEDVEPASEPTDADKVEMDGITIQFKEEGKGSRTEAQKGDSQRYGTSREADKPEAMREQLISKENAASQVSLSLLDEADSPKKSSETAAGPSATAVVSTWASMKTGFQNFKANMRQKKNFLPLHNAQVVSLHATSSSESLDDIFEKLKQKPSRNHADEFDFDDDGDDTLSRATG